MLVSRGLPHLRRRPLMSGLISAAILAGAISAKLMLPYLPPYITLFPAVLLCALIGGKWVGRISLVIAVIAAAYIVLPAPSEGGLKWQVISLAAFSVASALIVFVIDLLDTAISRLQSQQEKLDLVLQAAGAAIWEFLPGKRVRWDDNFYTLIGLDPQDQPPSAASFLAMVHPEDRAAMAEARDLMERGEQPTARDEYRLMRPDGSMIWLENRRVRGRTGDAQFIGLTQDITHRKQAEEKIRLLLRELAHRVKNQLAVITRIATETRRQAETPEDFNALFQSRMMSLSRSHDLLVKGGGTEVDLRSLLEGELESFGALDHVRIEGVPLMIKATAAQYLAMAFHELATNAMKHGALARPEGEVTVRWLISQEKGDVLFHLTWIEKGAPMRSTPIKGSGFGTQVLERLAPYALSGKGKLAFSPEGIVWSISAPLSGVTGEVQAPALEDEVESLERNRA